MAANRMDVEPYVSLHLDHVPLAAAISVIRRQSGVNIGFSQNILPSDRYVSVQLENVTVSEALRVVLRGTDVKITQLSDGKLLLFLEQPVDAVQGTGVVRGIVRDAKTKQPLRGAMVTLDDSGSMVRTDAEGRYVLASASAGTHRVSVRTIGYARQSKMVTVVDGQSAEVDFSLDPAVNTLDQVVVTVTGAQRYRELGHVVSQINADSLVKEAPITSLSELLTARVPGLQVMGTNGGVVGGEVALRIRGTTTTSLDPQPIVVVDGVRYKNTNSVPSGGALTEDARPFNAEPRSPLNDLNVNDIEKVEIVKGPSASTLYGPDAANGVIVITTKRGHAGKPEWHFYAYPDLSSMQGASAQLDPPVYQGWGHVPSTDQIYQGQCTLFAQARDLCVLDSVRTVPNAVNDPNVSVLARQRPQWHSGASVSGGTTGLAYFFSGNMDTETGQLRLSPVATEILKGRLGVDALNSAMRTPNSQQTLSLHTNISSTLSPTHRVTLVGNYTQATQRAVDPSVYSGQHGTPSLFLPGVSYTGQDSTAILYDQSNTYYFLSTTQQQVQRITAALSDAWQPTSWLSTDASLGTDLDNTTDRGVRTAGQIDPFDGGEANDNQRNNTERNAHAGAVATGRHGNLSFRTSLGIDYSYSNLDGLNTVGDNLAPGSTDITTASVKSVTRLWSETAQLGGYGEEVVGLYDRLFLTASLRLDGSTTFGDAYQPRPYPKLGVSWVVSEEPWLAPLHRHGLDELRLRYSRGSASRYPTSAMKNGVVGATSRPIEGTTATTFFRSLGANPELRPERSREAEYGADATIFTVVRLGLTWYHRRTFDELQLIGAPSGLLSQWQNVGDLSAHGIEATLDLRVIESAKTSLNLAFTYANNTNRVDRLGVTQQKNLYGSAVVGYPLSASFGTRTIGYADTTGGPDGIIADGSEVVRGPVQYLGVLVAPQTYTFTPTLTLFGARLRISSLFDRQTGGVQFNPYNCSRVTTACAENFLKSTPLLEQAINIAGNPGDRIQSSDFTRWREVSVTGDVPLALRERLHLSRASVSVQVRNLALWTPFHGSDPESAPGMGTLAYQQSDIGAGGIPQPRVWAIRFDIAP
jgi:TonB-dependent SusC/RagA subfamily outer membrane receptor